MKSLSVRSLLVGCSLLVAVLLSGCENIVGAVHEGPLAEDVGERTWGRTIDDGTIESKAKINIRNTYPILKQARIRPESFNGIVLLVGQVPNNQLMPQINNVVKNIRHVKYVENQLTYGPNITWSQRIRDRGLAAEVRSQIKHNSGVAVRRIKVVVENDVLYLMGLVNQTEAEAVVNASQNVQNLSKIVKVFEYLN